MVRIFLSLLVLMAAHIQASACDTPATTSRPGQPRLVAGTAFKNTSAGACSSKAGACGTSTTLRLTKSRMVTTARPMQAPPAVRIVREVRVQTVRTAPVVVFAQPQPVLVQQRARLPILPFRRGLVVGSQAGFSAGASAGFSAGIRSFVPTARAAGSCSQ